MPLPPATWLKERQILFGGKTFYLGLQELSPFKFLKNHRRENSTSTCHTRKENNGTRQVVINVKATRKENNRKKEQLVERIK